MISIFQITLFQIPKNQYTTKSQSLLQIACFVVCIYIQLLNMQWFFYFYSCMHVCKMILFFMLLRAT